MKLDVTAPADAQTRGAGRGRPVRRLDVLVINAGYFNAGIFEEITPADFRAQIGTSLFGPIT